MTDWTDAIPVLALVFTLASFWWIWLRRGHLRATPPDRYLASLRLIAHLENY